MNFPGNTPQERCTLLSRHIEKENARAVSKLSKAAAAGVANGSKAAAAPRPNATSLIVPAYPGPEHEENFYKLDTCEEIAAELRSLKEQRNHCSQPRTYCWASLRVNMDTYIENVDLLKEHFKC